MPVVARLPARKPRPAESSRGAFLFETAGQHDDTGRPTGVRRVKQVPSDLFRVLGPEVAVSDSPRGMTAPEHAQTEELQLPEIQPGNVSDLDAARFVNHFAFALKDGAFGSRLNAKEWSHVVFPNLEATFAFSAQKVLGVLPGGSYGQAHFFDDDRFNTVGFSNISVGELRYDVAPAQFASLKAQRAGRVSHSTPLHRGSVKQPSHFSLELPSRPELGIPVGHVLHSQGDGHLSRLIERLKEPSQTKHPEVRLRDLRPRGNLGEGSRVDVVGRELHVRRIDPPGKVGNLGGTLLIRFMSVCSSLTTSTLAEAPQDRPSGLLSSGRRAVLPNVSV